jgi:hypothetical protein
MRSLSALLIVVLGFAGEASAQTAPCTGLCLQQVNNCPGGGTTTLSGTVYAPNGIDPLPNVTVYIPNAPVAAFTSGVSCDVVGGAPSGSPIVGAITAVDGSFTLGDVPVGSNIPLVIVSGRWRRQLTVPSTTVCTNTSLPASFAVMPQNHTQGDIPLFAIATGSEDQVECVLLKVGIDQSEFTDPGGGGRINLFGGGTANGTGVTLDSATPTQASLMGNSAILNSYDVLMLPCEGSAINKPAPELANLISFADAGGRVYASHFSYSWMYQNPPFSGVASWLGATQDVTPDPGVATVDTSFTAGQTLATWLQNAGATTTLGQMPISTLRKDTNGVIAPTQSWLALNNSAYNNPVMQFVFNTPIAAAGATINQCGRVLYNEYHVENPATATTGKTFPNECSTTAAMTPQEKLLEYSLFELTDDGGQPSLAPTTQNFGVEAVSFTTATQTFTWSNNSSFPASVTSATVTGDFGIVSNGCASVAPGTSCKITVVFTPTALGARTGTLTVVSSGNTLTSALTGMGVPGFTIAPTALSFANQDVGASATQTLTLTSNAPQALPVPAFVIAGDYSVSTKACGSSLAAMSACTVSVTFLPIATGPRNGTLGVNSGSLLYSGLSVGLTGNGVDFSLSLSPTSGSVVAGDAATSTATLTPIAGFATNVSLTCTVAAGAVASACGLGTTSVVPSATVTTAVNISTTSQYTVVGFGGFGGHGYLWLLATGSGWLLFVKRRSAGPLMRDGLLLVLLAAMSLSATGCSGKVPAKNSAYTLPGNYLVTLTATDGFLVHSATYSLTVTAK